MKKIAGFLCIAIGVVLIGHAIIDRSPDLPVDAAAAVNGVVIPQQLVDSVANQVGASQQDPGAVVETLIDHELLYQEGVRMGLLESDPAIRARVIQGVIEQVADQLETPTDRQLEEWYQLNIQRYRPEQQMRFLQIYDPVRDGDPDAAEERLATVARAIRSATDFERQQSTWPHTLRLHDSDVYYADSRLISIYGPSFADRVTSAPVEQVAGPFQSSLGLHLIWVSERRQPPVPAVEAIRAQLVRDWQQDQKATALRQYLQLLRQRADIQVSSPSGP